MPPPLLRISVIGTSCSGKTTFARRLAAQCGFPHIELDAIYWLPGWQARPEDDFKSLVDQAVKAEQWVADGNYRKVREIVWQRATHVIWLNYPFHLVFWRALRRTVHRAATHTELFSGNYESWQNSFFSRDSILWWVISTYGRRKRQYSELFATPPRDDLEFIQIKNPRQAELFLTQIRS
jgi:adenylate kinase family enzyme